MFLRKELRWVLVDAKDYRVTDGKKIVQIFVRNNKTGCVGLVRSNR